MQLFDLKDKKIIKSCYPILDRLYKHNKKAYINLFFYEKDLEFGKLDLSPLIQAGILEKIDCKFRAKVQVYPLSGKFICTDFNYSRHRKKGNVYTTQKDGVWGILGDETPIMAKRNITKKGDYVLDLATGSGMIAIFCALKAKKVVGTDINPKAINYANFNAILNDCEDKVEFRLGDLFKPVKGEKFDLIIWNGPTVAVPKTRGKYPIYSDGGPDGASFTRKFINQAFNYLNPKGKLQWYDCATGTKDLPTSIDYLTKKWGYKNLKVIFKSLTSSPVDLERSFEMYAKYNLKAATNLKKPPVITPLASKPVTIKEEQTWHRWLKTQGHNSFYYALIEVFPNDKFEFEKIYPKQDIRTDRYLTKYWLWLSYPTILKKLKVAENF